MNKLAAISLVVFLQAMQVAQAASGEKDSDKPDGSRPASFAGTGGAAGGAGRAGDADDSFDPRAAAKYLMNLVPGVSLEDRTKYMERFDAMMALKEANTMPDGSYSMPLLVTGMNAMGMPITITAENAPVRDPLDSFYTLLPNGDRVASDGTRYRVPADPLAFMEHGGRMSPGGRVYCAVKEDSSSALAPAAAAAAAAGGGAGGGALVLPDEDELRRLLPTMNLQGKWALLLSTRGGFEALSEPVAGGKLPEDNVSDKDLQAQLKFLREGYALFEAYGAGKDFDTAEKMASIQAATPLEEFKKIKAVAARIAASGLKMGFTPEQSHKACQIITCDMAMDRENKLQEDKYGLAVMKYSNVAIQVRALTLKDVEVREQLIKDFCPTAAIEDITVPRAAGGAPGSPEAFVLGDMLTVLRNANKEGKIEEVRRLASIPDGEGNTPLHLAAYNGKADMVSEFLAAGVDMNLKNARGDTALHFAAANGHLDIVNALLARGADVNATNAGNDTALFGAAANGHLDIVTALLDSGTDVNATNVEGIAALHAAAFKGYTAIVFKLLTAGADVNATNARGNTALHHAAFQGHAAVVTALLTAGANVNTRDAGGNTALHQAAFQGHAAVVTALLAADAAVDVQNNIGFTALRAAALEGRVEIIKALLAKGANANISSTTETSESKTPLEGAVNFLVNGPDEKFSEALTAVGMLLRAGADVNVVYGGGDTLLIRMMRIKNPTHLKGALTVLLDIAHAKLRPSIDQMNKSGQTALTMALERTNDLGIIKRLLAAGADPSLGKLINLTPLQYATFLGNGPVANLIMHTLISQGKPLECFADDSFSALGKSRIFLHVIAQGGDYVEENMEYLLRTAWGLRVLSKTEGGKLPEQIVSNPALKARMKALREGYEWFQRSLRVDISRDVSKLTALQSMAKYITSQPKDSGNFPPMEWDKAARILADLPLAIDEAALNARILEADDAVSGVIEELKGHIGQLNAASKDHKKKWNENIARACTLLETQYAVLRELTEAKPEARSKVEEAMIDLRDANETVRVTVNKLLPHARKKAAAGGAGGGGAAAAAAAASEPEERFDFATADLDVETLTVMLPMPPKESKKLMDSLIDRMKAKGQNIELSENLKKRWSGWIEDFVTNYETVRSYQDISREVYLILRSARTRGIPIKFIVGVLKYSTDQRLQKAYSFISALHPSDAATFAPGSVASSKRNPGGDGSTIGTTGIADEEDFRGMDLGGFGAAAMKPGSGFDFEGGAGAKGTDTKAKSEFVLREEEEIPEFTLPEDLDDNSIRTLLNLINHDIRSLDENGLDIYKLFNALGSRFEARYDDETAKKGNLRITDIEAARALGENGGDPREAMVIIDPKHNETFKGPKLNLILRVGTLLSQAGISKEVVTAFAASKGIGVTAAAAAASVSSRTSGYSDYASGGGGGGGGGRSRTGGGAAASGGGGGGWNAARGSYTYGLPGK